MKSRSISWARSERRSPSITTPGVTAALKLQYKLLPTFLCSSESLFGAISTVTKPSTAQIRNSSSLQRKRKQREMPRENAAKSPDGLAILTKRQRQVITMVGLFPKSKDSAAMTMIPTSTKVGYLCGVRFRKSHGANAHSWEGKAKKIPSICTSAHCSAKFKKQAFLFGEGPVFYSNKSQKILPSFVYNRY